MSAQTPLGRKVLTTLALAVECTCKLIRNCSHPNKERCWKWNAFSRYRSGSHSLRIETGRMSNPPIPREERLCRCNTGIQSLNHVLFDCPLVADLHNEYRFVSIDEAFTREDITQFLMKMECKLGIKTLS